MNLFRFAKHNHNFCKSKMTRFFFSSGNPSNHFTNDAIWKNLNIELMKSELDYKIIGKDSFEVSKKALLASLGNCKNHLELNGKQLQDKLQLLKTTPSELIQQLSLLAKHIEERECTDANMYTSFYNEMNSFINQKQQDFVGLIAQSLIKFKYSFLFLNQIHHTPNILNSHPSHFQKVWNKIKIIPLNQQKIVKDYRRLDKIVRMGIGILCQINQFQQNDLLMLLKVPFTFAGGFIKYKKKILESLIFYKNPSLKIIQRFNTIEKSKLKQVIELNLPTIKSNKMIYIPSRGQFQENLNILKEDTNTIPVKILFNKQIPTGPQSQQIQEALLHIHGGGFILFSSFVSENHTRLWAKQSSILIFSIDYKLAPKHPFPQALYDCLQVYRFLAEQIHKYFKINLKRIFVGGDSAGGNLSCGLTSLLMQQGLKIPQGLFLIYPSLDLRKVYYPSRKYTLNDLILWPSFAHLCTQSYLQSIGNQDNPLASPILITQQFVGGDKGDESFPKKWPKTYMIVGTKDPLRDQSLLLMQRMVQAGVACECRLYQGLKHGFMNTQHFIHQSQVPWKHTIQIINSMFNKQKAKDSQ